jgi:hypothetical protein
MSTFEVQLKALVELWIERGDRVPRMVDVMRDQIKEMQGTVNKAND